MSNLISPAELQAFRDAINIDGRDTFFNKDVIWKRCIVKKDRYGEDGNLQYEQISLKGLENSNTARSWPVSVNEEAGEIDRESLQLFFILQDFIDLGKVTNGYPSIDPTLDRFIIDGITYKTSGDILGAQAFVADLFYTIVLVRDKISTGTFR